MKKIIKILKDAITPVYAPKTTTKVKFNNKKRKK